MLQHHRVVRSLARRDRERAERVHRWKVESASTVLDTGWRTSMFRRRYYGDKDRDQRAFMVHRRKVETAHSSIDNKMATYDAIKRRKLKKLQLDQERLAQREKDRLSRIRSTLDNKTPPSYHEHRRAKKVKADHDRAERIQEENRQLLERLLRIDVGRARLDNQLTYKQHDTPYKLSKIRESEKIERENNALLRRIEEQKSVYDHRRTLTEYKEHLRRVNEISKFPMWNSR
ncbi:sperm axonemal maintenance protein CFAP97D1-like [Ptychodera flava]|uniref:sperm axonemal maintenance protein CFAP97D1-like n=1 Tax=Ptychodera flava TaxID=63121 RepID=UPI003969BD00